ncbi:MULTISPECIES: hypothetical protein [unclassified Amycolatopsis]|uniref:hypothetical protein n=1 Tax=unclassified Amycolatopsis TaxID=2618356 RepID=UPI002874D0ED|nr:MULTISPECIES: hypothetical protein [unclassified Amycolatopsis]MDS0134035.1 hypothetical protein [Amycolatopsis sp. 505]MDS0144911.1 hypothetical protein [Amycolatopsis sp. CM201R]
MSEPKDPEQLLADALRAQAVFAPSAASPKEPATDAVPTSDLPSAYGLLSGASADSLERERAALDAEAPTTFAPRPPEPARASAQLPAYWILLLAVLLGLAAGSVVGLLTLV